MIEQRFGSRVRQLLNHGLKDIPPASSRRLEAARHLALARQKQSAPELALALGGASMRAPFLGRSGASLLRQTLAIISLLVGMWLAFYWHSTQYINELEEVDIALLSDDLPPEAFLDDDIYEWLKDDSSPE
jgi:hypothetical protein